MNLRTRRRAAISGGSSGSSEFVFDNVNYWGSDLGYDEEFDQITTTLPSGWSWLNQGSSTYTERFSKGIISGVAETGIHWRGITRSFPTEATWEAIFKRSFQSRSGNEMGSGLVMRADNGKILTFYWYSINGTNQCYLTLWNDNDGSTPSVKAGSVVMLSAPGVSFEYLRIRRNSASSYDFAVSGDGLAWHSLTTAYDVGALLTPTSIGFASYVSANVAWAMSCDFLRVREIDWTPVIP
jgi:hypothetical protein